VREYLESDRRFHSAFNTLANNEILTETIMGLRDKMRLYGISSSAGIDRQRQSVAEHYRIIELAKSGEAEILKNLMRQHIMTWEPIFAEALARTMKSTAREPLAPRRAAER
jgi:DNA-binding GntR family transcriptional regulator